MRAPWLAGYFQFRQLHSGASRAELLQEIANLGGSASELADRSRGALLGLALGDALGMPLEFSQRDSRHVQGLERGGPFNLEAGQWTDDTSMACCLAYSLIHKAGFDPAHQMACYSYWYRYGAYSPTGACFDIGGATRAALEKYLQTGEAYAGSTDPRAAGNGSLMRLAPVPVFFGDSFEASVHHAALSSRTTHQSVEAVDACRYFAALLHGALTGCPKEVLLDGLYSPVPGYWASQPLTPSVLAIAQGSYQRKTRDQIQSSGYVLHTLEAAVWAFHRFDDARDTLLAAVNLGDDADTVGAVCGQIAGAFYGETGLPMEWIRQLYQAQGFYHFADDLMQARQRALGALNHGNG